MPATEATAMRAIPRDALHTPRRTLLADSRTRVTAGRCPLVVTAPQRTRDPSPDRRLPRSRPTSRPCSIGESVTMLDRCRPRLVLSSLGFVPLQDPVFPLRDTEAARDPSRGRPRLPKE